MTADYTTELAKDIPCPCVALNYGTRRGVSQGCPICLGTTCIDRLMAERYYDHFVQELHGSGEWEISQPPTLPIREQPMRLAEILAPNGTLMAQRAAMQTVGAITYWVGPEERLSGFYLLASPYRPGIIALRRHSLIPEIAAYAASEHLTPHPHGNAWLARDAKEVGRVR